MFHDDVSAIPKDGCSILVNDYSIQNYSPDRATRRTYIFRSGRWFLERTETQTYGWNVSNYNCLSSDDLSNMSSYTYLEPFFYGMALVLFLVAVFAFFKSIKGFLYGI